MHNKYKSSKIKMITNNKININKCDDSMWQIVV